MAANKFQLKTVMELGKVDEFDAEEIVTVIENEALVSSWMNGRDSDFKYAIKYAKKFIANGHKWE